MKRALATLYVLFILSALSAQDGLTEKQVAGNWDAEVKYAKSEGTKVMFNGSTITLNSDYSFDFSGKMLRGFSGIWELNDTIIVLNSDDSPGPIILSDISKDSCTWINEDFKSRIVFYKKDD